MAGELGRIVLVMVRSRKTVAP
uniref:Predicted protein n=1 Tax=Hordeum vulgare subsp. vulgare TaxID=112509 RepID=F2D3H1_HORVV|nr:predicted protein [Hordeum vulgare subsp. vulgare]